MKHILCLLLAGCAARPEPPEELVLINQEVNSRIVYEPRQVKIWGERKGKTDFRYISEGTKGNCSDLAYTKLVELSYHGLIPAYLKACKRASDGAPHAFVVAKVGGREWRMDWDMAPWEESFCSRK